MNSGKRFIIKISVLVVFAGIIGVLRHWGDAKGGIGGGGYDLSALVYSLLLLAVTAVWMIWVLTGAVMTKDKTDRGNHITLLVIGLTLFIITWMNTPRLV